LAAGSYRKFSVTHKGLTFIAHSYIRAYLFFYVSMMAGFIIRIVLLCKLDFSATFFSVGLTACREDQFRCNDGVCLNINQRCNFIQECVTGEDEKGCSKCL